jgi:hypothetical protein
MHPARYDPGLLRCRRGRARHPDRLPFQEALGFLGLPAIPFAYMAFKRSMVA